MKAAQVTQLFDFTVSDGTNNSDPAVMTIDVTPVNDAPVFSGLDDSPNFVEGGTPVVLDGNATISDLELDSIDDYNGATLTLGRAGGANADDLFSETGTLAALTEGGSLVVGGTTIGDVTTNSGGTLLLTFNSNATTALVDAALQQIAYSNSSDAPPASVTIEFTIDDENTGAQGIGGNLNDVGAITVSITPVNDLPAATDNSNTVSEDISPPVSGNMIANDDGFGVDSDPDLVDVLTVSEIDGGSDPAIDVVGTLDLSIGDSDGSYTYTLDNSNPTVNLLDGRRVTCRDLHLHVVRWKRRHRYGSPHDYDLGNERRADCCR